MKEIGERLREAREAMGISVEEAAEDLKIRPAQLENIEDGNKEAFKDVFYLKFFNGMYVIVWFSTIPSTIKLYSSSVNSCKFSPLLPIL